MCPAALLAAVQPLCDAVVTWCSWRSLPKPLPRPAQPLRMPASCSASYIQGRSGSCSQCARGGVCAGWLRETLEQVGKRRLREDR